MKKIKIIALSICMVIFFAACSQNKLSQNINKAIEDWKPEGQLAEESQIDVFPDGDFTSSLGFIVKSMPDDTALAPQKFYAIDKWFAQIEYKSYAGQVFVLRIAREGNGLIANTYSDEHTLNVNKIDIDGVSVEMRDSNTKGRMILWNKDGFQYLLHSKAGQTPPSTQQIQQFINQLVTVTAKDKSL